MSWDKNGTPETLTGTDDNIEVTSMGGKKFNVILSHTFASGNTASYMSLNNSTASEYARRQSENGGGDDTAINATTVIYDTGGNAYDKFEITYICGISGEEKLAIGFGMNRGIAGAGTAPVRGEYAWKWANTATITTVENDTSAQQGTYASDSNISALGSD
tara:strand:+ start:16 stop:498 length:483 start_codon:yes stop_codon:yes gene_type:complete